MSTMIERGRRTTVTAFATAAAALALGACGGDDEPTGTGGGGQATAGGSEPVQITYAQPTPPTLEFYPPIVAEELGFFADEGVEAELAPAAEEIPMTAFLENGDADIALADLDEIVLAVSKGGEEEVIFSPQHSATEGTVVPADSPIQDFTQLEGKRVGLASEENTAIFRAQLKAAGLAPDSVETVIVGTSGPTVANVIREGEIDAYTAAVSDFTSLNANGIELRNITPDELAALPGNPMATLPHVLEDKGDAMVGFLRAWSMGQYVGLVRPDVVEAIVREEIPEEWRNEAVAEAALQTAIGLFEPESDLIGALRRDVWVNGQDLLTDVGIIEEPVQLDAVLNDSLIEEINDWDRAAVEQAADAWAQENM